MIARARERRRGGRADDLLPRRDPPLQQGPAGRAAARGRGGAASRWSARRRRTRTSRSTPRCSRARRSTSCTRSRPPTSSALLRRALERGECGAGAGRRRRGRLPRRALGRRRARRAERARARVRDRRRAGDGDARSRVADAEDALQRKAVLYDKDGDQHYDYISAWIKATRGSDPDASLYYLAAMLEGGEDPRFIARRMIVLASEDIGNADPQALAARRRGRARRRARRPAGVPVRARAGGDLPLARAEVRRREARARRRPRAHRRARRRRPARAAAQRRLPGGAQARARAGLRLPARPPRPRQRRRSTCRRGSKDCASTPPTTRTAMRASGSAAVRRARGREL